MPALKFSMFVYGTSILFCGYDLYCSGEKIFRGSELEFVAILIWLIGPTVQFA